MSSTSRDTSPDGLRRLRQIEEQVKELERQLDQLDGRDTDFAIRIDRVASSLISNLDGMRASAHLVGREGQELPAPFWERSAAAISALTSIRKSARAVLGEER